MGRKSLDQRRIGKRRRVIADITSALEAELELLRSEDLELAIAERVLGNLSGGTIGDSSQGMGELDDNSEEEEAEEIELPRQPSRSSINQIKTVGEMALELLIETAPKGMTSTEVLNAIRQRWVPTLMRTSLSPPLSRLKARGAIKLDGDYWKFIEIKADGPE